MLLDFLWIGQDYENASQTRNFRGWIDDARIYDFSLTASEIEYVRTFGNSGTEPASGPFSWYKLDESSGTSTEDSGVGLMIYWLVQSAANLIDPEPQYQRAVNFRDYVLLANDWLVEPTWPSRP